MKLRLLTVGKAPRWIAEGFDEYARRLPGDALRLVVVSPRRGETDEQRLLAAVREQEMLVVWDQCGERISSEGLANLVARWRMTGRDVALLVGGARGLGAAAKARAAHVLSLSDMTFPHRLARVLVAEQIFRAWAIETGHPYHRRQRGR